jgi:hypothetical protein
MAVPTIVRQGAADGVSPVEQSAAMLGISPVIYHRRVILHVWRRQ